MSDLSKILRVFVLPVAVAMLLILAGVRLRRRWLVGAGVAVLWLSSTPLVGNFAVRSAEGWAERVPAPTAPLADAIVVLSEGRIVAPGKALPVVLPLACTSASNVALAVSLGQASKVATLLPISQPEMHAIPFTS